MRAGFECGVGVSNFNDMKVGDILECFKIEKTTAVLDPAHGARPQRQERAARQDSA